MITQYLEKTSKSIKNCLTFVKQQGFVFYRWTQVFFIVEFKKV